MTPRPSSALLAPACPPAGAAPPPPPPPTPPPATPPPGVPPPRGAAAGHQQDGRAATKSLELSRRRLPRAQRRAVNRALRPGKTVATIAPGAAVAARAAAPPLGDLPAILTGAVARL